MNKKGLWSLIFTPLGLIVTGIVILLLLFGSGLFVWFAVTNALVLIGGIITVVTLVMMFKGNMTNATLIIFGVGIVMIMLGYFVPQLHGVTLQTLGIMG